MAGSPIRPIVRPICQPIIRGINTLVGGSTPSLPANVVTTGGNAVTSGGANVTSG